MKTLGILLAVLLSLLTVPLSAAGLHANHVAELPPATKDSTPIDIYFDTGSEQIWFSRLDFWPDKIVFVGIATAVSGSECFSREDFTLRVNNSSYHALSRDYATSMYGISGPGTGFFTQCLSRLETEPIIVVFDPPVTDGLTKLEYLTESITLPSSLLSLSKHLIPAPTATPTPTFTPTSTPASAEISLQSRPAFTLGESESSRNVAIAGNVSDRGVQFALERIDFWDSFPDDSIPTLSKFAVFTGRLLSTDNKGGCLRATDFDLHSGTHTYVPSNMYSAQEFYDVDFPGSLMGQCASGPTPTYLVFDVALDDAPVTLQLLNAQLNLDYSLRELYEIAQEDGKHASQPDVLLPTLTPDPNTRVTPTPENLIVDLQSIIGTHSAIAELTLGSPLDQLVMPAGTLHTVQGESEARTYFLRGYTFDAIYDTSGILRSVQLSSGLADRGLSLKQWPAVFEQLGLPTKLPDPDVEAAARLEWQDVNGLVVEVMQDGVKDTSAIWSVLAYLPPEQYIQPVVAVETHEKTPTANSVRISTATPTAEHGYVAVLSPANLRSGPTTNHEIVGGAQIGDMIKVVATNGDGEWLAVDNGAWIAAFLVEPIDSLPTATASPTPPSTPTPNISATSAAEQQAYAQATVDARIHSPPDGTWCEGNSNIVVCVGDFRYATEMSYKRASAGTRYVPFVVYVKNFGSSATHVNPHNVSVIMSDGRTYGHDDSTYSYWSQPMDGINIVPGASAQGGIVFHVPRDVAIKRVVYETSSWFDQDVIIDLTRQPD